MSAASGNNSFSLSMVTEVGSRFLTISIVLVNNWSTKDENQFQLHASAKTFKFNEQTKTENKQQ